MSNADGTEGQISCVVINVFLWFSLPSDAHSEKGEGRPRELELLA